MMLSGLVIYGLSSETSANIAPGAHEHDGTAYGWPALPRPYSSAGVASVAPRCGHEPRKAPRPTTSPSSWPGWSRRPDSPLAPLTRDRRLAAARQGSQSGLVAPRPAAARQDPGMVGGQPHRRRSRSVFYMFSGPDFLYVDAFFPDRTTYVMSGLEPVGQIPTVAGTSRGGPGLGAGGLRASIGSVLNYSFFITQEMQQQAYLQQLQGRAACPLSVPCARRQDHPRGDAHQRRQGGCRRRRRHAQRRARREDRVLGRRWEDADALLFPDRPVRRGAEAQRVPQVLRAARRRRRLHQERLLPAAQRQLLRSFAISCWTAPPP